MALIEREKVIEAIHTYFKSEVDAIPEDVDFEALTDTCGRLIYQNAKLTEIINEQPAIEPRRGRWLPENRTMDAFWVCSACGFSSEAFAADKLYKFCPNCGADMREVTE